MIQVRAPPLGRSHAPYLADEKKAVSPMIAAERIAGALPAALIDLSACGN